jgi:ABC-type amino acid transport substrate-binding protein
VQGEGLILDFEKPPTGKVSRQNYYVMISRRAVDRENMAILKPFDAIIPRLHANADEAMIQNDEWLNMQDEITSRE